MTLLATAFIACFSGNIASAKDVHIQKAQLPCDAFIRGSLDTSAYFQKLSRLQAELKRMHPDLVVEPDYDVEEAGYQGLAVFRGNKCLGSLYYVALSREKMMKGRTKIYGSRNQGQYLSLWLNVEMLLRHPQTKIIETKLIQDNEKILGSFTEGDSENLETAFFLTPAGKTYLRLGFDALTNLSTEDDPNHFEVSRP
jgi:hypothetical protein